MRAASAALLELERLVVGAGGMVCLLYRRFVSRRRMGLRLGVFHRRFFMGIWWRAGIVLHQGLETLWERFRLCRRR